MPPQSDLSDESIDNIVILIHYIVINVAIFGYILFWVMIIWWFGFPFIKRATSIWWFISSLTTTTLIFERFSHLFDWLNFCCIFCNLFFCHKYPFTWCGFICHKLQTAREQIGTKSASVSPATISMRMNGWYGPIWSDMYYFIEPRIMMIEYFRYSLTTVWARLQYKKLFSKFSESFILQMIIILYPFYNLKSHPSISHSIYKYISDRNDVNVDLAEGLVSSLWCCFPYES